MDRDNEYYNVENWTDPKIGIAKEGFLLVVIPQNIVIPSKN